MTRQQVQTTKTAISAKTPEEARVIVNELFKDSFTHPNTIIECWNRYKEDTVYCPNDNGWDSTEYFTSSDYTIISLYDITAYVSGEVSVQPFEAYPKLANAIQVVATNGTMHQSVWQDLTDQINSVCAELLHLQAYPPAPKVDTDIQKILTQLVYEVNQNGFLGHSTAHSYIKQWLKDKNLAQIAPKVEVDCKGLGEAICDALNGKGQVDQWDALYEDIYLNIEQTAASYLKSNLRPSDKLDEVVEKVRALIEPLLTPMHEQHLNKEVWTNLNRAYALLSTPAPALQELGEISDEHLIGVANIMEVTEAELPDYKESLLGILLSHETSLSIQATDYLRQFYNIPNKYTK